MEILTTAEVMERLKISRTTLKQWAAKGLLPKPLRIPGARLARWNWDEIQAALEMRAERKEPTNEKR